MNRLKFAVAACAPVWLFGAMTASAAVPDTYRDAIVDAAMASPAKQLPLRPIPAGPTTTIVAWTSPYDPLACTTGPSCVLPRPTATRTDSWTWVTLDPEVKERCAGWAKEPAALGTRLGQLLGLQPGDTNRVFVVMSVRPSMLKRACLGTGTNADGKPVCTLSWTEGADDATRAARFAAQQMAGSYYVDGDSAGYPFTRLGYTYDWAPDAAAGHYGASELILPPGTAITVTGRMTTEEYCRR